jgi:hypothetical protein
VIFFYHACCLLRFVFSENSSFVFAGNLIWKRIPKKRKTSGCSCCLNCWMWTRY